MSAALLWRQVVTHRDSRFMVKGVELANVVLPFGGYRFQVCEHRSYALDENGERIPHVCYRVRDAETVTDAEVKDGFRPAVVRYFDDFDDAFAWCEKETCHVR